MCLALSFTDSTTAAAVTDPTLSLLVTGLLLSAVAMGAAYALRHLPQQSIDHESAETVDNGLPATG